MIVPSVSIDLSRLLAPDAAGGLAIAMLVGLAVGLEREWSGHAMGPSARFAGVRTFLLLGLAGGIAGLVATAGLELVATVILAGAGLLTCLAYWAATQRPAPPASERTSTGDVPDEPIHGTTEVAALVVIALGALAGLGAWQLSTGAAAVVVFVLAEKNAAHQRIQRIGAAELRAAVQLAVLSLVVLPLLPEGPFGPFGGVRPRQLWIIVLIFSALNFAGYVARRMIGASRGYGVTGLLGGLVSSTAVTLTFSRQSRLEPEHSESLGLGVVAACTVLIIRVCVVVLLLNAVVFAPLASLLLPMFILGAGLIAFILWRTRAEPAAAAHAEQRSPLRLWSAVQMAIAFQFVLMLLFVVRERWGTTGILTSAAVLGFTDMDALTFSMTKLGTSTAIASIAARAIAIGIISNTVLKLIIAVTLGTSKFRRVAAGGLVALGVVGAITLLVVR